MLRLLATKPSSLIRAYGKSDERSEFYGSTSIVAIDKMMEVLVVDSTAGNIFNNRSSFPRDKHYLILKPEGTSCELLNIHGKVYDFSAESQGESLKMEN